MQLEQEDVKIKYITNCAVFLEYGTVKILIDGIFSGRQPFNIMDPQTEEAIIEGTGEFAGIDYLFVTHCHNDHYNGSKILRFLEHHPGAKVVLPSNARLDKERLAKTGAEVIFLNEEEGILKTLDFGCFKAEYMKTKHLTYYYPNHYCYNIILGKSNILLTADMYYEGIPTLSKFTKKTISSVFLCHIFLWHRKWRKELSALGYDHLYFYHLPEEGRDKYGYRPKAIVHFERSRAELPAARLLGYEEADQEACTMKQK